MQVLSHQRGVSLIEVMMAGLIFSIGLIGLAGLMVMATRSNHAAYLRTQVTFLASNMADRMRANPVGLWNGNYNATTYPISGSEACNATTACAPEKVALRDQQVWSTTLTTLLPNAKGTIVCTDKAGVGFDPTAQINARPPYGGNCEMTISWTERKAGDQSNRDAATQVFAWEFQP